MTKYCILLCLSISLFACEPVKNQRFKSPTARYSQTVCNQLPSQKEMELLFLDQLITLNDLYINAQEDVLANSSLTEQQIVEHFNTMNLYIHDKAIQNRHSAILITATQFIKNINEATKQDYKKFNLCLRKELLEKQLALH